MAGYGVDEPRQIGVAAAKPLPVLTNEVAEDLVLGVGGRDHDLVSHSSRMPDLRWVRPTSAGVVRRLGCHTACRGDARTAADTSCGAGRWLLVPVAATA